MDELLLALKAKLDNGEITQEQYNLEVTKLDDNKGGDDDKPLTRKDIEALLEKERQSAGDKVRTEYSKKLSDIQREKDLLELEKMTEAQRAEHEKKQYEKTLKDREDALNAREVEIEVVDRLSALQLPLSFKPFFTKSATKEDAQANIKALADVWSAELKTAVETRLKGLGENRGGGSGGTPSVKKWTDLTLTEQGQLLVKDPTEAKRLASASGITLNI